MAALVGAQIRDKRRRLMTADSAKTAPEPADGRVAIESGRSSADWQNYRQGLIKDEEKVGQIKDVTLSILL